VSSTPVLDRRIPGANLPPGFRAVGVARVPDSSRVGAAAAPDEALLRRVLEALREMNNEERSSIEGNGTVDRR
jgi:hypothetical protein